MTSRQKCEKALDDLLLFTAPHLKAPVFSFRTKHREEFYFLAIGTWIKSYKTASSISLLCKNGLSRDAGSLLRTLVELLVTFHYIVAEDQDERTRKYIEFKAIENKKMQTALDQNKGTRRMLAGVPAESRARLQGQFEQVMERRETGGDTAWQRLWFRCRIGMSRWGVLARLWRTPNSWSGHSLEVMAHKVGLAVYYDVVYRMTSEIVHSRDLTDQFEFVDLENLDLRKGIRLRLDPDEDSVESVLPTTIFALLSLLDRVYSELQHPALNELRRLDRELKEALRKPPESESLADNIEST